ncbi:MAG: hypothetical protein AAB531_05365 [Patescibacteria group bacterium]
MSEILGPDGNLIDQVSRDLAPHDETVGAMTSREKIQKDKIGAIILWFGHRNAVVNDDIRRFRQELMLCRFGVYATFEIPEAEKVKDEGYPAFNQVSDDLGNELRRIKGPLVSFIVTTPEIAEKRPWISLLPKGLIEARRQQGEKDTFIYKIIMDGAGKTFEKEGQNDPSGHFSKDDMRAHELGGVYLRYSHDHPTISLKRLVELMNRIVGSDLPGEYFPDYSDEDIQRIAWSIKREDFNMYYPMERAILKYPIIKGRPKFSF